MLGDLLLALEASARGDTLSEGLDSQALVGQLEEARASAAGRGQPPSDACLTDLREAATSLDPVVNTASRLGLAWVQCFDGTLASAEVAKLPILARTTQSPALTAEAATLRAVHAALGHRGEQDAGEALQHVRRASRMTRTEAMPEFECLANLALARMRRIQGHPHLSARILSSLARWAPSFFPGWLAWEALMSRLPAESAEGEFGAAVESLRDSFTSLGVGERARFAAQLERAENHVRHRGFHEDVDRVREAFDPLFETRSDFRYGIGNVPPELRSLVPGESKASWRALVFVGPDRAPTRILSGGASFARSATLLSVEAPRTATALAVLAAAGAPGLTRDAFFKAVYRFDFAGEKHRAALAVLLHRARAELGDRASIVQDEDSVRLKCVQDLLLADPRCAAEPGERVLALVADGMDSAQSIAASAHLPLRSVQEVLRQLVDEGSCDRQKRGRAYRYVVEDTTFREPTDAKKSL